MSSVQQVVWHTSHQVKAVLAWPASSHQDFLLLSLGAYPTVQQRIQVTSPPSFWENKPVATGMELNEEDGRQRYPSARCNGCSAVFYIPFGSSWCQPHHSPATCWWGWHLRGHLAVFRGERSSYVKKEAEVMLVPKCELSGEAGVMMWTRGKFSIKVGAFFQWKPIFFSS